MMLVRSDARQIPLRDGSVQCCVTSPPYWGLRDYGADAQLGLEATPDEYVANMVEVFREVRRALRDDGTLWLNLGDSYAGSWGAQSRGGPPSDKSTLVGNGHVGGGPKLHNLSATQIAAHPDTTHTGSISRTPGLKPKDLVGIPWRVAFALQADGWYLRSDIIWAKPNPMPESVTDRPTKAHEYLFLLAKSQRYYYDAEAIAEASFAKSAHDQYGTGCLAPGQTRQSGNRHRRIGAEHGRPGHHRGSSVPWAGSTRNRRTVWTVATQPYSGAHFATFPPKLIEPCIRAGSPVGGVVLDPFVGSGTTCVVATQNNRHGIGLDLAYQDLAMERTREVQRRLVGA